MANLSLKHIYKVYPNGAKAVNDFNMQIEDKEFIVFVGPSGCGKSTTLRMIAGLEEITAGELKIGDMVVNGMEPKDRDIAMVFQNYALYPHMTIFENLAFGLRMRKIPDIKKDKAGNPILDKNGKEIPILCRYNKEELNQKVQEAAEILEISDYLKRKPKEMSGGQRQRVALGRAIVRRPKVFLMDEPLSNLDAKLRVAMRSEIVRIHEDVGATTIYVTHDQIEAMTMASRIVVMKDGFIQQIGEPNDVYLHPNNMFVAGFIGTPAMNFIHGKIEKGSFIPDGIDTKILLTKEQKKLLRNYENRRVVYGIRPENLIFSKSSLFENAKNYSFKMTKELVEKLGDVVNVHGNFGTAKIILKMNTKYYNYLEDEVTIAIETEYVQFFNESTTRVISEEDCAYEEVENTQSLEEDNVVVIDIKKKKKQK